jgi:hypothetical protein
MKCETCVTNKSECIGCRDNPIYKDVPTVSLFQEYKPTCPQGFIDCVYDPAYIKYINPNWYKELYGDLTPEEASKKHCNENDEYCYDDEDN